MIIGLSGPASSGKTTISLKMKSFLEKSNKTVYILDGVTRSVIEEYGMTLSEIRKDIKTTFDFQTKIVEKQIEYENELKDKYDFVITTRTIYDYMVYSRLYLPVVFDIKMFHNIMKMTNSNINKRYNKVFYCKALNILEEDGVRDFTDYEQEINEYEKLLANGNNCSTTLHNVSTLDRMKVVKKELSALL